MTEKLLAQASENAPATTNPVVKKQVNSIARATATRTLAAMAIAAGLLGCEDDRTAIPMPTPPAGPPGKCEGCPTDIGGTGGSGGNVNVGGTGGCAGNEVGGSGGSNNQGGNSNDIQVNVEVYEVNPDYIGSSSDWATWENTVNEFAGCYPNCNTNKYRLLAVNSLSENIKCPASEQNCKNPGYPYIVASVPTRNNEIVWGGPCRDYTVSTTGEIWGAVRGYNSSGAQTWGPKSGTEPFTHGNTSCPSYNAMGATYNVDIEAK